MCVCIYIYKRKISIMSFVQLVRWLNKSKNMNKFYHNMNISAPYTLPLFAAADDVKLDAKVKYFSSNQLARKKDRSFYGRHVCMK